MKKIYFLLVLAIVAGHAAAQTPTYAEHVAPLLYANCSSCHHAGSVGPFPLMSYNDAFTERYQIKSAVMSGYMPPWHPDTSFQDYAQERYLTQDEIATIVDWVNGGGPEGNPSLTPPPPVFPTGAVLPNHDMQLRMPAYASTAATSDDYMCVALDPNLTTAKTIKAFEVLPGDREIVHHVLVYVDESGTYTPGTVYPGCVGPTAGKLLGAYVPGGNPIQFPSAPNLKMGLRLNPGAKIVFAMHYPAGSAGRLDSTAINLHFYPDGETGIREISADPLISEWGFCIDADSVQTVSASFPPGGFIPSDYSVLSVFPHCHLLGKNWNVYGVNYMGQDTVPFIKINHWDFDWQGFYFFKHIQKIPSLHHLEASCVYDNTANNIHNPHTPPQQVCAGLNTTDEMMLVYFHYLPYQAGDELVDMDSLLQVPVTIQPGAVGAAAARLTPFPNPSNEQVTLDYYIPSGALVALEILDVNGRVLRKVWSGKQGAGQYHARWDGRDQQGQLLPAGMYFARMRHGETVTTVRIVRE